MSDNPYESFYDKQTATLKNLKSKLIMVLVTKLRAEGRFNLKAIQADLGATYVQARALLEGDMSDLNLTELVWLAVSAGLEVVPEFNPGSEDTPLIISVKGTVNDPTQQFSN